MDSNYPMVARILAILIMGGFFLCLRWSLYLLEKYKPSWFEKIMRSFLSKEEYEKKATGIDHKK